MFTAASAGPGPYSLGMRRLAQRLRVGRVRACARFVDSQACPRQMPLRGAIGSHRKAAP